MLHELNIKQTSPPHFCNRARNEKMVELSGQVMGLASATPSH
jgi:hypothetical protein